MLRIGREADTGEPKTQSVIKLSSKLHFSCEALPASECAANMMRMLYGQEVEDLR